jgi:fibronectin-binding autotransporter adhesin
MIDRSNLAFTGGLMFEDAIQFAVAGGASALDGNILLAGAGSGHPAYVTFTGRTTGTNINSTIHEPVTGSGTGQHVLWLGRGADDTFTVMDGATGVFDARTRIDFSAHSGVLLDALGVVQPGGTMRVAQSVSNFSDFVITSGANNGSLANVGDIILRGNIEGQGGTTKESLFEILLPAPAPGGTISAGIPLPLAGGAPAFGSRPFGGLVAESTHDIVINGTGFGGLRVVAKARPDRLFSATALAGGAAIPDPTSNTAKLDAYLTAARLAAMTGSGGFITPVALGQMWSFPAGGEWSAVVPVGLRVFDSNPAGVDLSMAALSSFSHDIAVDAAATLDLGSTPFVFSNATLHGEGTVTAANGITVSLTGTVSPGAGGNGTLTVPGTTLQGTFIADVSDSESDLLAVVGDLILGGASSLVIPPASVFAARDYIIATITGTRAGAFASVAGLAPTHELDYEVPGVIRLSRIAPVRKWNGASSGVWDTASANWQGAATYADGDRVILDDTDSGTHRTITLPSPVAPARITVDTATGYTLIGAVTGGATLFKNGVGSLTLSGANSFTGGIVVNEGTLRIGQDDSLPDAGTVRIATGATLDLNGFAEQVATLTTAGSVLSGSLGVTDLTLNNAPAFAPALVLRGTLVKTGSPLTIPGAVNFVGMRTISVSADGAPELTLAGQLSGGGIVKEGAGSLVLAGTANSFTGGAIVSAGIVRASAAGAFPAGGSAVVAVSAMLDLGGFPAVLGAVANDGTVLNPGANLAAGPLTGGGLLDIGAGALTIHQDGNSIYTGPITAQGGLVKNGTGRITLNNAGAFGATVRVDGGALRLGVDSAAGTSHIAVNSGGTLIVTSTHSNAITLAGGVLGGGTGTDQNPFTTGDLIALAGTISTVITADPELPAANSELVAAGPLRGGGDIVVVAGPNVSGADYMPGFRLRGAGVSDFTGVVTVGNGVKFELETDGPGPFSPMGGGRIVMTAGTLEVNRTGTYSQINLRSNFPGDTSFGNDVEISGAGTVNFGPVGSAPLDSRIILGNLKLGANQTAAVNKNASPIQVVQFASVTLTGGDATFAPGQQDFGFSGGSDLVLGPVSELVSGSGIIMAGNNRLTLLGPNTYTGATQIHRGTTVLAGPAALPAGTALTMDGGQLDISDGTTSHARTVGSLSGSAGAIFNSASDGPRDFIVDQVANSTFAGNFAGGVALVKRGTGALRLLGSQSFETAVRVEGGTLIMGIGRSRFRR